MDTAQKILFDALSKDRTENAHVLEKTSMKGVKRTVVEKYSDQAHFIYELLQNADDAKATYARFILESDRLIFAHNGTRHFSVSDPNNEDVDTEQGKLGDINAITSIANSNKISASIGKFGVGFKAVFQYTNTPHIYDPDFHFKIERFIVPIELDHDFPERKTDETLFVFPFDHLERDADKAYREIFDKLQNLSYPLLFLSNLEKIDFSFNGRRGKEHKGSYAKEIIKAIDFAETKAECINVINIGLLHTVSEKLWLFSRIESNGNRRYSVGFFIDDSDHLCAFKKTAFCFFPTKEVTGLNFIIHAPFLLTESRESIRAGNEYNETLISLLAELSADSLEYLRDLGDESGSRLIDDDIFDIIPYDKADFINPNDKSSISYLPFYNCIQNKFKTAKLLPATDGYVDASCAFWADVSQLPQLFSNEQLSIITDTADAHWVFESLGRDSTQRSNRDLAEYIDTIVPNNLNEEVLIKGRQHYSEQKIPGITGSFIEKQSIDWLHSFYKWISETTKRTQAIRTKPIFLNQEKKAVSAFDNANQLVLFLPKEGLEGYTTVHPDLLLNSDTTEFIKSIGVKEPETKDYIYNVILKQYENSETVNPIGHFKLFFEYYRHCNSCEIDEFVGLIQNYKFVLSYNKIGDKSYNSPVSLYYPTSELLDYFETKPDTSFVAIEEYKKQIGESDNEIKLLYSFLNRLGVKEVISVSMQDVNRYERTDIPYRFSNRGISWKENVIDGCKEIVEYTSETKYAPKSVTLWNCLLKLIKTEYYFYREERLFNGVCNYFYRKLKSEAFPSADTQLLKNKAWMLNKNGEFAVPNTLFQDEVSETYDELASEDGQWLLNFLGVQSRPKENDINSDAYSNLSEGDAAALKLGWMLQNSGISEDELPELLEKARKEKEMKSARTGCDCSNLDANIDSIFAEENDDTKGKSNGAKQDSHGTTKSHNNSKKKVITEIVKRIKKHESEQKDVKKINDEELEDDDSDGVSKPSVSIKKKCEREKEKSSRKIETIAYQEELEEKANTLPRYSYGWFNTLLELESFSNGDADKDSKEISISFGQVEREAGTKRTLVLKHPNQYIPQFMEDLADIPLVLHFGDKSKTVPIEVANIKSYTLRVKMKNSTDIDNVDLSSVTEATINARSPAFLLEELRKRFLDLNFPEEFDMQKNLCKNIEFIFGPPGTGKTTYLAKNVLIPFMHQNAECKILVLTPTNKSADVLVKRIIEESGDDESFSQWLVRFGTTTDEDIENREIYKDKTYDITSVSRNVTVTTIARFPYDYFIAGNSRVFLNGINWDYIIIDEASMIPLANIVLPLYMKTPTKFIIAGDPFQIQPITAIDIWKDENIYTMVKLNSFKNPSTIPHQYPVTLLTTQYRSIPQIGDVFSKFTYDGILEHYRTEESQRKINTNPELKINTLNLIKFPVSKYESIYRCKHLKHSSSYQVYSALFTYEYVCFLARDISQKNPGMGIKIGVIAPYRAQADMISKLVASEKLPNDVEVQVGTIHGFQGDECDIIFAVFNTPPTISSSKKMFLNNRNIINVAISRARDYLFIIMPDDNTENISNLVKVKRVEELIKNSNNWIEILSPELEILMFGDSQYLENNAFSTSHQSVNVYGLPEKCYEVRTEEFAVDVQVHKPFKGQ